MVEKKKTRNVKEKKTCKNIRKYFSCNFRIKRFPDIFLLIMLEKKKPAKMLENILVETFQ